MALDEATGRLGKVGSRLLIVQVSRVDLETLISKNKAIIRNRAFKKMDNFFTKKPNGTHKAFYYVKHQTFVLTLHVKIHSFKKNFGLNTF